MQYISFATSKVRKVLTKTSAPPARKTSVNICAFVQVGPRCRWQGDHTPETMGSKWRTIKPLIQQIGLKIKGVFFWGVLTFNPTCRGLFHPIFIAGYLACWWFQLHLKKIFSQIGSFLQVGVKIKHIWNHHPHWVSCICPPCIDFLWKSKTKQRMVCRMIHIKDSLLPMGKVLVFGLPVFFWGVLFSKNPSGAPDSLNRWSQACKRLDL